MDRKYSSGRSILRTAMIQAMQAKIETRAIVCDCANTNISMSQIFIPKRKGFDYNGVISREDVSFQSFLDPTHRIFIIYCATHMMKSLRNAHLTSRDSGHGSGLKLMRLDDEFVRWEHIVDQYERDQQRGGYMLSRLTPELVVDDGDMTTKIIMILGWAIKSLLELLRKKLCQLTPDLSDVERSMAENGDFPAIESLNKKVSKIQTMIRLLEELKVDRNVPASLLALYQTNFMAITTLDI